MVSKQTELEKGFHLHNGLQLLLLMVEKLPPILLYPDRLRNTLHTNVIPKLQLFTVSKLMEPEKDYQRENGLQLLLQMVGKLPPIVLFLLP